MTYLAVALAVIVVAEAVALAYLVRAGERVRDSFYWFGRVDQATYYEVGVGWVAAERWQLLAEQLWVAGVKPIDGLVWDRVVRLEPDVENGDSAQHYEEYESPK